MHEAAAIILTHHRLDHLPQLRIDPEVLRNVFADHCSMANCNAHCCREGVLVDLKERDRILEHTALIQRYLEPQQEHNPDLWFDDETETTPIFPRVNASGHG